LLKIVIFLTIGKTKYKYIVIDLGKWHWPSFADE